MEYGVSPNDTKVGDGDIFVYLASVGNPHIMPYPDRTITLVFYPPPDFTFFNA